MLKIRFALVEWVTNRILHFLENPFHPYFAIRHSKWDTNRNDKLNTLEIALYADFMILIMNIDFSQCKSSVSFFPK